ncbi:glycoside hydrolase family 16 protein [Spongiimicrobium salis]|uniref:glycoside hydrolase family 16 protein n=1 Tax=Spongiimicrobium salis TaxID=1667022 RepID=UPI00374CFBE9
MKKTIVLSFFLLSLVFACSSGSDSDTNPPDVVAMDPPAPPDPNRPWNLVFEDEFDGDLSQWNVWEGGAFNNEIQLYRGEQLSLADGILTITTQREEVFGATTPFDATPKDFDFVSGRIESKTTFGPSSLDGETEYRFISRIRMPEGFGMWPAFWSYGDPWPVMGEIDIIEARGNLPNEFSSNIFYGTEPGIPITRLEDTVVEHEIEEDITADFHIYELIWTVNTLEIRFDDRRLHLYNANARNFITNLFGRKQMVVLNNAVGGVFFPNTDPSTYVDTATMQVDWVRVYKR